MDTLALKKITSLIEYAVMAPSFRNSQPWKFSVGKSSIRIHPDFSRHLLVSDPEFREFYLSLGCVLENLNIALGYHGYGPQIEMNLNGTLEEVIEISFHGGSKGRDRQLFEAIPKRMSYRGIYDDRCLNTADVLQLLNAKLEDNILIHWVQDREQISFLSDLAAWGDEITFGSRGFLEELPDAARFKSWPRWLGRLLMRYLTAREVSKRDEDSLNSSSGVIVFSSPTDSKQSWLNVGRAFERFVLGLSDKGLHYAHFNQLIEFPELRKALQRRVGLDDRLPQVAIGIGYGHVHPASLRRPIDEVFVDTEDSLFSRLPF